MWRWEDVLQTPTIGRTLRSDALGKNINRWLNKLNKHVGIRWVMPNRVYHGTWGALGIYLQAISTIGLPVVIFSLAGWCKPNIGLVQGCGVPHGVLGCPIFRPQIHYHVVEFLDSIQVFVGHGYRFVGRPKHKSLIVIIGYCRKTWTHGNYEEQMGTDHQTPTLEIRFYFLGVATWPLKQDYDPKTKIDFVR